MSYVSVDETHIYYEVRGKGTPILFIHPPAMGHVTFQEQYPLDEYFQIIMFDIRGHGKSGYIKNDQLTIEMISRDVVYILDKLEIDKAVICGYSSGASVALDFALKFPERTEGIILCGGFSEVNSFLLHEEFNIGIFLSRIKAIPFLSKVLSTSHAKTKNFQKDLEGYVKETNSPMLKNLYEHGLTYNCSDDLSNIQCPILLVYGSTDYYIHHYQSIFLEKNNNVKIVYISNVGHQIPTKQPHEFNRVVHDFVHQLS